MFCACGEKTNMGQNTRRGEEVSGCDCSMLPTGGDTVLGFDDRISKDILSSFTLTHSLFNRGGFVLGFQILTRHHLVP